MERELGNSPGVDPQALSDLANTLADVVYIIRLEPDMGFEFVSDAVTEMVGYTPAEHYADPGLGMRLVDPEDVAVLASTGGHPLGEVFEYTVRWVARDGSRVWTHHRCVTTRRDDGALMLHGIARDVSALKEIETRFRLLAENTEDLVVLLGPDQRPAWVSPSVRSLLGYSEREFLGLTRERLVHPDDLPAAAAVRDAIDAQVPTSHEVRLRRNDGYFKWCQVSARRGTGDELIITFRDRDEQVRARQAARSEQEHRRAVIESMPDPYALFDAVRDASGAIIDLAYIDVNWAACAFLGILRERVLETTMLAMFPNQVKLGLFAEYAVALETGRPYVADAVPVDLDGVRHYFDIRAVPLGEALLSFTWRDVSDRVGSQQRLERAENRYRLLAENSSDVVALIDGEAILGWVSPSLKQTSGFSSEDIEGIALTDFVHPEDLPRAAILLQGEGSRQMIRLRHADGHYVRIAAVSRAVVEQGHRQYVIALRDITAEQVAIEQLTASEEKLHNLLDAMLEPFVLLQAIRDDTGAVVDFEFADANPAALAVYSRPEAELIGQRLSVLHPGAWHTDLFQLYVAVVDQGVPIALDDWSYPQEVAGGAEMRYDVRAVRVGDAVSQTWRNVTERYDNARRLAESQEQFRLLAENASDVVLRLDEGTIAWVSPSVERTLGWPLPAWTGRPLSAFIHPEDTVDLSDGAGVTSCRLRILDVEGAFHWVHLRAKPVGSSGMGLVVSLQMIDDVMAFEAQLEHRAAYDELTGALKRAEAIDALSRMARHWRTPGDKSAVLFCDIDDFKSVNDSYGHVIGDEVLRVTADRMRQAVRGGDLFARMGGDEFLIVLDGLP